MSASHEPVLQRLQPFRRWIIGAGLVALVAWLLFLDSHSLTRRALWHHEYVELKAENERLREEIDVLERKLEAGVSDEVIEQIAREEYGMRAPGETVYPVDRK